jgi:hypothetical protein
MRLTFPSQIMNLDDANERFELEIEVLFELMATANTEADELSTDAAKAEQKRAIGTITQPVFTAQSNSLKNSTLDITRVKKNQLRFGANLYDRITKGDPRNFTNDQRPDGWKDKFSKVHERFCRNAAELERAQHRLIKVKDDINIIKFNRGVATVQRAVPLKFEIRTRLAANVLAERIAESHRHAGGVDGAVCDSLLYLYKRFHIPPSVEDEAFDKLETLNREVGRSVIEVLKSMAKTEQCQFPLLTEHFNRQTKPIQTLVTNVLSVLGRDLLVLLTALDVQHKDGRDESSYVEKRARAYRFIAQIASSDNCAFS